MLNRTKTLIVASVLLLSGCAPTSPHPHHAALLFTDIQVSNLSTSILDKVVIHVPKTNRIVECDHITPKGFCGLSFKAKEYQGHDTVVDWVAEGQQWQTVVTAKDLAPFAANSHPVVLELKIYDAGQRALAVRRE